jgi:hypothetical protein
MPIRFRCAYCNQLMAISRRKAATVVRCPKCAGDIIVPSPDGAAPMEGNARAPGNAAFEDPNFDALLDDEPAKPNAAAPGPRNAPARSYRDDSQMAAGPDIAQHRRGLFLPMRWLLVVIGVVVLLSAGMFGLGYFVGQSKLPAPGAAVPPALPPPVKEGGGMKAG